MKKGFVTGLVLGALVSSAWAGTMGSVAEENSWRGFYVGANLGGIWGRANGTVTADPFTVLGFTFPASPLLYNANTSSFFGGGQAGYNWQRNQFVFGTEISVDGMNLKNTHTIANSELGPNNIVYIAGDSFSSTANWQAAWIGHLGVGIDNWHLYGLGGVALTELKVGVNYAPVVSGGIGFPGTFGSESRVLTGGTVGAGAEYALTQHLRAGAEYRYTDYGRQHYRNGVVAAYALSPTSFVYAATNSNMSYYTNQVVVKLDYQV